MEKLTKASIQYVFLLKEEKKEVKMEGRQEIEVYIQYQPQRLEEEKSAYARAEKKVGGEGKSVG